MNPYLDRSTRYTLDIDSTYRNRQEYPSVSNFTVKVANGQRSSPDYIGLKDSAGIFSYRVLNMTDPISLEIPKYCLMGDVDDVTIEFDVNNFWTMDVSGGIQYDVSENFVSDLIPIMQEVSGNNYYINNLDGDTRRIISSSYTVDGDGHPISGTITTETTLTGNTFFIKRRPPRYHGTITGVGSTGSATITSADKPASVEGVEGYYFYLFDNTSGAMIFNPIGLINNYDPDTGIVTVGNSVNYGLYSGAYFEILPIDRVNDIPIVFSNNRINNIPVYEIELTYLSIPNAAIQNGIGYSINKYSYVYVVLYNVSGKTTIDNVIYSNNPNSSSATFKVPLIQNTTLLGKSFTIIQPMKCVQTLKLRLDQPLHFGVLLQTGHPINFTTPDTHSPHEPVFEIQINATFIFRQIE